MKGAPTEPETFAARMRDRLCNITPPHTAFLFFAAEKGITSETLGYATNMNPIMATGLAMLSQLALAGRSVEQRDTAMWQGTLLEECRSPLPSIESEETSAAIKATKTMLDDEIGDSRGWSIFAITASDDGIRLWSRGNLKDTNGILTDFIQRSLLSMAAMPSAASN